MSNRSAQRRAFTLIELLLVVAIAGVAALMAIPRYAGSLQEYRANLAARRIAADLSLVQARARSMGATRAMTFDLKQHTYTLTGETDPAKSTSTYTVAISQGPYNATLVSASFNSTATVSFNGYGVPSSSGTVVVKSGTVTRTVTLEAVSGQASIQ